MKGIVRSIFVHCLALTIVAQFVPGFLIFGGIPTILIGGLVLTILFFLMKPILQIISLPFNFVTFGLFSFVTNAIILWTLSLLVRSIVIHSFVIPGISFAGFVVPKIAIHSIILAYIVIAAFLTTTIAGIRWIINDGE